jgi:multisubunit Na+/H+ antiporter MnhG subunit
MVMAWLKLRRRNIAPLLNANGWAINSDAIVSVLFGNTLTEQAEFPLIKMKDPFKKGLTKSAKWSIAIIVILLCIAAAIAALYFYGLRICFCIC